MAYYAYIPYSTGSEKETWKPLSPRGEGWRTRPERRRNWHSLRGTSHLQERTMHQLAVGWRGLRRVRNACIYQASDKAAKGVAILHMKTKSSRFLVYIYTVVEHIHRSPGEENTM